MKIAKQKGTKDIFSDDMLIWHYMEENIRKLTQKFNISEIRTPVFEATELFARGVGDETDIVDKEMYTFLDKGGRSITLRPELTAGVVRSYIENGMSSLPQPIKYWYIGNMYRYEKMQKGRYREFSQFGVEIFGSSSYLADLEAICVSYEFMRSLNIQDKVILNINSLGNVASRQKYIKALKDYLSSKIDCMCDSCKARYNKNVLRILDCKVDKDQEILKDAPKIIDFLDDESKSNFDNLREVLKKINIPYVIDDKLVRGLDYYNGVVYEYKSKDLGLSVGGGGRYDGLVETLGGIHTPAVGFGIGLDRIQLLLKENIDLKAIKPKVDIYFLTLGKKSQDLSVNIVKTIHEKCDLIVENDICERSVKAQLKYANNIDCKYVCIIGQNEIDNNVCKIKNMKNGSQIDVELNVDKIIEYVLNEEKGNI